VSKSPKSELAKYAFGYSDKKPGWTYWLVQAAVFAFCVYFVGPELIQFEKPQ